jgi:multiple sugar transport system substrate-binding protein
MSAMGATGPDVDAFGNNNPFVKDQVGAQLIEQWYINVLTATSAKIDLGGVTFKDLNGQPTAAAGGTSFAIPVKSKNPVAGKNTARMSSRFRPT